MIIDELPPGQDVKLEVEWIDNKMEIGGKIVANTDSGMIMTPYRYHGEYIDLSLGQENNIAFNLYYIDDTKTRIMWKNVHIKSVNYKGSPYYLVNANPVSKFSYHSERRATMRIPLNFSGVVTDKQTMQTYMVQLADLNSRGIAFTASERAAFAGYELTVHIDDTARGKNFSMDIDCHIVRHEPRDGKRFYGCRIRHGSKALLAYLFLKGMEYKAENR